MQIVGFLFTNVQYLYKLNGENFHLCAHDQLHETQRKETSPIGKGFLCIMQNNNSRSLSKMEGLFCHTSIHPDKGFIISKGSEDFVWILSMTKIIL